MSVKTLFSGQLEPGRSPENIRVALLHPGPKMRLAGELLADLLLAVFDGQPLEEVILAEMQRGANPLDRPSLFKMARSTR